MRLDPAVTKLLSLDPSTTTVSSHGGVGMSSASTAKITTKLADGSEKDLFMKTGRGKDAEIMFQGEHASLNAIHSVVPTLCPASIGHGRFAEEDGSFLVTEFLELGAQSRGSLSSSAGSSSSASARKSQSLAVKLAKLHTTPAPVPEGYDKPVFGFPVTTCCGDTPQPNPYTHSWAHFYAENRLRFILGRCEKSQGADGELRGLVTRTADEVVPRLIGDDHLNGGKGATPVVVHGDLWSGNASRGRIGGRGEVQDVVYDPSACWAHSEYELGIMRMFGGFGEAFFGEYHGLCGKTEPVGEFENRVALYQLYHYLNHHALFGGGYRSSAVQIMKQLLKKYGSKQ